MGVMMISLAAYAAVRVVSLHHVDALLHRRQISGVRVGTAIEMTLIIATAIVTAWVPAGRSPRADPSAASTTYTTNSAS